MNEKVIEIPGKLLLYKANINGVKPPASYFSFF